jgi:hypothetical protein
MHGNKDWMPEQVRHDEDVVSALTSTIVTPLNTEIQTIVIPAHDCREKVRARMAREAGLGHAGGRAMHGAIAEAGIQLETIAPAA